MQINDEQQDGLKKISERLIAGSNCSFIEPDYLDRGLNGYFLRAKHSDEEDVARSRIIKNPFNDDNDNFAAFEFTAIPLGIKEHKELLQSWNKNARNLEKPHVFISAYIRPFLDDDKEMYDCFDVEEKAEYISHAIYCMYVPLFARYGFKLYYGVLHRGQLNDGVEELPHFHLVFVGNFDRRSAKYKMFIKTLE